MRSLTENLSIARGWKGTQSLQQFQAWDFVSQVPGLPQDKGQVSYAGHLALHPLPPTGGANKGCFFTFERGGKGRGQTGRKSTRVVRDCCHFIHPRFVQWASAKDKIMSKT